MSEKQKKPRGARLVKPVYEVQRLDALATEHSGVPVWLTVATGKIINVTEANPAGEKVPFVDYLDCARWIHANAGPEVGKGTYRAVRVFKAVEVAEHTETKWVAK